MNIYKLLNETIEYIENNLENKIDYKKISQIMLVNEDTAQRVFRMICDITLSDYIRKRRLSKAVNDLCLKNMSVLDVSIKYQYESSTSFSRAFERFHGVKPSKAKENANELKVFPKIVFEEKSLENNDTKYSIVSKDKFELYGICKKTTNKTIKKDAPKHFEYVMNKYLSEFGYPNYGMTVYKNDGTRLNVCEYWTLYDKKIDNEEFSKVLIPAGKWIAFKIDSQETKDIQKITEDFYEKLRKSIDYKLKEIPELEYYHDNEDVTEFFVPIEN